MIRVERGREVAPGIWEYSIPSLGLSGRSRQPFSDACRRIIALAVDPQMPAGRFRDGQDQSDLTSTVGIAAGMTVAEPDRGRIHFAPFRPWRATAIADRDSAVAHFEAGETMTTEQEINDAANGPEEFRADFHRVRGYANVVAICDEMALWQSDDSALSSKPTPKSL